MRIFHKVIRIFPKVVAIFHKVIRIFDKVVAIFQKPRLFSQEAEPFYAKLHSKSRFPGPTEQPPASERCYF